MNLVLQNSTVWLMKVNLSRGLIKALLPLLLSLSFSSQAIDIQEGAVTVTTGGSHSCALTKSGAVKCWGSNSNGQLGNAMVSRTTSPVAVSGLSNQVSAVAAGYYHTCALINTGGVKCWGANNDGQLADSTLNTSYLPVDVSGITSNVSAISAGGTYTCLLSSSGSVQCSGPYWGSNQQVISRLYERFGSYSVASVRVGYAHICALTSTGGIKCLGMNDYGQFGNNTRISSDLADVSGLTSGVKAISAGRNHTCALTNLGGVKCWGQNDYGQLGDNSRTTREAPVDVAELTTGAVAISAGWNHTCALTITGGIKCWGWNGFGQLGDSTINDRYTPIDVSGLTSGVASVSSGYRHTCAVINAGGVKCWGSNANGELGDTTNIDRYTPTFVSGFAGDEVTVPRFLLSVFANGSGTGTITSPLADGITCGSLCSANYASGTSVTLTATPALNSTASSNSKCNSD